MWVHTGSNFSTYRHKLGGTVTSMPSSSGLPIFITLSLAAHNKAKMIEQISKLAFLCLLFGVNAD
jgi:hypothetical protein